MKHWWTFGLMLLSVISFTAHLDAGFRVGMTGAVKARAKIISEAVQERMRVDPWNAPVGAPIQGATLLEGWQDLREVPAPVNVTGGWTDSAMVTADGQRLYFGYTRYDFWQFYSSGGVNQVVTGPGRPGMSGNAFKIFTADLTPNGWSVAFHPVNHSEPELNEASASPNIAEDLLVFTRFDSAGRHLRFSTRTGNVWNDSVPVFSTTSCEDDNGFIVGDLVSGATLYFESKRADNPSGLPCGTTHQIFTTFYKDGAFTPITLVPGLAGGEDFQPFVTPDQSKIYWTGTRSTYGVFTADRQGGGTYGNIRAIITPNFTPPFTGKLVLVGEANVATLPQGDLMYLMCGIAGGESGGAPMDIVLRLCTARRPR